MDKITKQIIKEYSVDFCLERKLKVFERRLFEQE